MESALYGIVYIAKRIIIKEQIAKIVVQKMVFLLIDLIFRGIIAFIICEKDNAFNLEAMKADTRIAILRIDHVRVRVVSLSAEGIERVSEIIKTLSPQEHNA